MVCALDSVAADGNAAAPRTADAAVRAAGRCEPATTALTGLESSSSARTRGHACTSRSRSSSVAPCDRARFHSWIESFEGGTVPAMELVPFRHWVAARADDDHTALRFEDQSWTYREFVAASAQRAAFLLAARREVRSTSACCSRTCPTSRSGSARRRSRAARGRDQSRRAAAPSSRATSGTPTAS